MKNKQRKPNRNIDKSTPPKHVTWADLKATPPQQQNMEKAVIRYMVTKTCGAKELNKSTRQCCEILPFIKGLSPEWKGTTYNNFARDEHVQHQALYDVIAKIIETPPTYEAIQVERKDLQVIAAQKGEAPPQQPLLPEEKEHQSAADLLFKSEDGRLS